MSDTINVNIMGMSFTLRAGDDPVYIRKLAEYVDHHMGQMQSSSPKLSQLQVAVLTCLNLADNLQQAQSANTVLEDADARLRRILERLE